MSDVGTMSGHEILLWLAGRVDDDLLALGRELVAVGEEAAALELLVASLHAARKALPHPVRDGLAHAVERRLGPEPARMVPPGGTPSEGTAHRFVDDAGAPDTATRIHTIVDGLAMVERSGARTALAWRLTPAGTAPGPVPHPVVLLVLPDPAPAEVLAYQVGAALARAGLVASVEAFVEGPALPPYQRAALAAASPGAPGRARNDLVDDGVAAPSRATSGSAGPAPGPAPSDAPVADTSGSSAITTDRVGPIDPAAVDPARRDALVDPLETTTPDAPRVPTGTDPLGPGDGDAAWRGAFTSGPDHDPTGPEHVGDPLGTGPYPRPGTDRPGTDPLAGTAASSEPAPGPVATPPAGAPTVDGADAAAAMATAGTNGHPSPRPGPRRGARPEPPSGAAPVDGTPRADGPTPVGFPTPTTPPTPVRGPVAESPGTPGDVPPAPRPRPGRSDAARGTGAHPVAGAPSTETSTEPSPYPGASSAGSDGAAAPEDERSWTEQWSDGSWSVPALPSGPAPDPDMEPATSPTPTSPPLSRVPPSPVRRSPEPDAHAPEPAARHRLDLPERPETGPSSVSGEGLDPRLTPNEQELLRRLQEELAARESGGGEIPPPAPPRNGSAYPESPSA